MRFIVTAGPTREPIDPVRFISNYSSGKMGYALARAARARGHHVILISGPTGLEHPSVQKFISIQTARELEKAIMNHLAGTDVLIMCAAVSDYRPEKTSKRKLAKTAVRMTLKLKRNPDILKKISQRARHPGLVGFALETHRGLAHAAKKLSNKSLDMIVLNDLSDAGAGFAHDTNKVTVIEKSGCRRAWPLAPKKVIAGKLIRLIEKNLTNPKQYNEKRNHQDTKLTKKR